MSTALHAYEPVISVKVCGKNFTLQRASSLEQLWDAMSDQPQQYDFDDERLPYWTELWPSSIALAEWIWQNKQQVAQKCCLDVGCGLGLTALVGAMTGAKVLAFDYEKDALHFAKINTKVNNLTVHEQAHNEHHAPLWFAMDWRKPALQRRSIDYLWGADVMYERKFAYDLLNFIDYALSDTGSAWIAEPCRSVYEHFNAELIRRKWHAKKVHSVSVEPIYAQPVPVTVQVWEIKR